ncbi:ester cyclase [Danxiaibacter flavus]|uniref:Ester cyclase n=1 Tax=Danxiaibacter flavus TaxID=3049108 RepID=A0ABV3Z9J8_9BACT|nr:ester cyclase [Chitinophagaceae bacterium DXS]
MPNLEQTLVYKWLNEVWNKGNIDIAESLMHENATRHGLGDIDSNLPGPEGFRTFYANFKKDFTNIDIQMEDAIKEDGIEAVRCTVHALHIPTNKEVNFSGICWAKCEHGKIKEAWNSFDFLKMYQQIGLLKLSESV